MADKTGRQRRTGPLTLHVIAQEKRLAAQEVRIQSLETENAALKEAAR